MPYTTTAKNLMLEALRAATTGIATASLHSADPGTTGANEISGGSPAYARKAVAFNAASGAVIGQTASDPVFDVPAGATVAYVGYWSGDAAPVFLASDQVTTEVFGAQGTYTLQDSQLDLSL